MAVDMDQVRAALEPEEPDYQAAAKKLGADALPYLEKVITGDHTGLAAKAAYLAGLIGTDKSVAAMEKATKSASPPVRIAAAAAARHLAGEHAESVLLQLVDDADAGVRKAAALSAPTVESEALNARVAALRTAEPKRAAPKRPKAKRQAKKAAPRAKKAAPRGKKRY